MTEKKNDTPKPEDNKNVKEENAKMPVEQKVENTEKQKTEPKKVEAVPEKRRGFRSFETTEQEAWVPKTDIGKKVSSGEIKDINEILDSGKNILEYQIVDRLMPEIQNELLLIGGRKGKGGGKQRIPVRMTTTMHRSGKRFTSNALAIVGNEDGIVGIGKASAVESRGSIQKAINKAKTNIIKVKRGCGSWECGCGGNHSVPFKTEGKSGSVSVVLMPAPKGLGLVADDASKKLLKLAGVKDVWVKTYGNTKMRINLITAVFNALKKLYIYDR